MFCTVFVILNLAWRDKVETCVSHETFILTAVYVCAGQLDCVVSNSVLRWKRKPCQVRLHVVTSNLAYIKIESLRRKNPTEIHNNLREVFGDNVVDFSTVSRWSAHFREG